MIVYFCDRQMNVIGHASTELKNSIRIADDHKIEEVEMGTTTLEFDLVYDKTTKKKCRELAKVGYYLIVNENDGWLPETGRYGWYTIISTEDDSGKGRRNIYAEDNGFDLLNVECEEFENDQEYTVAEYFEKFLGDSGFELGKDEIYSHKLVLSWDSTQTAKERLQEVAEKFDCEIWFSFEIQNFDVVHKHLNITRKRGQKIGTLLRLNHEVSSIIEKESAESIATALNVKGGSPHGSLGVKAYRNADGKRFYTWVKFADSPTEGMSDSHVDKLYIGIALDKEDQKESDRYEDYRWVKFCTKDAKGKKTYHSTQIKIADGNWVWIKWSRKNTGEDPADTPVGHKYIGIGYNKASNAGNLNDPAEYQWSRRNGDESEEVTLEGYVYDDGDFYVDGTYLKSRKALAKWSRYLTLHDATKGHITKVFSSSETDQEALFEEAVKHLKELSDKKTDYEVEIVRAPDRIEPGDEFRVADEDGELHLSARAMKVDTCHSDRVITITPGDYEREEKTLSQRLQELAERFAEAPRQVYTWIAYADDDKGSGITLIPDGKDYIGIAANQIEPNASVSDPSVYSWSKTKGEKGEKGDAGVRGLQGLQGEKGEQGIPGPAGETTYFHIKYSAVANPTSSGQISETPNTYIGTYTDFTESDSNDPKKYTWMKFAGSDGKNGERGIPGKNGENGQTSYLHIAYANSADGKTGFDVSASAGKLYIGQYTDFTENDSTDPARYSWTRIKGDTGAKGDKGNPGAKGDQGEQGISVKSCRQQYYLSTMSDIYTGGSWSYTVQPYVAGMTYWTRTVTVYSNGTTGYSDPVVDYALTSANKNASEANTAPKTKKEIMDKLTNGGKNEGLFYENGHVYLNLSMVRTGALNVTQSGTSYYFNIDAESGTLSWNMPGSSMDENGNLDLNGTELRFNAKSGGNIVTLKNGSDVGNEGSETQAKINNYTGLVFESGGCGVSFKLGDLFSVDTGSYPMHFFGGSFSAFYNERYDLNVGKEIVIDANQKIEIGTGYPSTKITIGHLGEGPKININNGLEIFHTSTPYIDFHRNNNTSEDWTERIMSSDTEDGTLFVYYTIANMSDRRLKKEIETIDPGKAQTFISKLKPCTYRYKNSDARLFAGFIAQDVRDALSEAGIDGDPVIGGLEDENHYLNLDYNQFIPYIVQCVQNLKEEVEKLKETKHG